MRTEKEMLKLIKEIALADDNIRAAYIEGSRVNPNVQKDIFQDYDIEYIVRDTKPFRENRQWIDQFGERLYIHYPEDNVFFPADPENCYGWQIQFADGNRMDLHVCTKENALDSLELYRVIVDKDNILPGMEDVSEKRYHVKFPREIEFQCTCEEFWWCTNNVAKGLWRDEIPYAMESINFCLRPELERLLGWKIGLEHDFAVNVGKGGKYFKKYLQSAEYNQFLQTYPVAEKEDMWKAVFVMCDLFHNVALELGTKFDFAYDVEEAENSRKFLEHVRELPADAEEVY